MSNVRYITDFNQAANVPQLRFEFPTATTEIDETMLREFVQTLQEQEVTGLISYSVTEASNGITTMLFSPSNSVTGLKKVDVNSLASLPDPDAGVITLASGYAYQFNDFIDLEGNRLLCAGDVAIYGTSSETAGITSTGLDVNTPLISSTFSLPIQNIRIYDVGYGVEMNGGGTAAIDWLFVNFINVPKAFESIDVANFIGTLMVISGGGCVFSGTTGTIAFNNSLVVTGTDLTGITVDAAAVITRRFRVNLCSIVATTAGATGINFSTSATVDPENYILENVNFSGGGTALTGVQPTDDKALVRSCVGVQNSSSVAMIYVNNNAALTTLSAGVPALINAISSVSTIIQRFSLNQAYNGLVYESSVQRVFYVRCSFTILGGNNKIYGLYIAKAASVGAANPVTDVIAESEIYITTSGSRPDTGFIHALVVLDMGNMVYPAIESTDGTNATIDSLNLIPTIAI